MDKILISKKELSEWCYKNMSTHTDWTGTRVETIDKMESVKEFVNKLYNDLKKKNNNYFL